MAAHQSLATFDADPHAFDSDPEVIKTEKRPSLDLGTTRALAHTAQMTDVEVAKPPKEFQLSPEGRMYLNDLVYALENAGKILVESKGDTIGKVLVADMPLPDYLRMLDEKLENHQDYTYIMSVAHKMIRQIEEIDEHLAALDEMRPPGKHKKEQQDV